MIRDLRLCVFISDARHSSIYRRLNFSCMIYKVNIKINIRERSKERLLKPRESDKTDTSDLRSKSLRYSQDDSVCVVTTLPQRVLDSRDMREIANLILVSWHHDESMSHFTLTSWIDDRLTGSTLSLYQLGSKDHWRSLGRVKKDR